MRITTTIHLEDTTTLGCTSRVTASRMMRRIPIMLVLGWIVWLQATRGDLDVKRPRETDWERVGPHTTLDECEKALAFQADAFEFMLKKRDPHTKRHGAAFLSHDATYLYAHEFFCLPDTTDPRESKPK
jgi:hypothetical protein